MTLKPLLLPPVLYLALSVACSNNAADDGQANRAPAEQSPNSSVSPGPGRPPSPKPEAVWLSPAGWRTPLEALVAFAEDVLKPEFRGKVVQDFVPQDTPNGVTNYNAKVDIAGATLTFTYEQTGNQTSGGSITVEQANAPDDSLDTVLAMFDKYFVEVETDRAKWRRDASASGVVFWETVVERAGGVLQTWSAYWFKRRDQTTVLGVVSCVIFPNSAVYGQRTCFAK